MSIAIKIEDIWKEYRLGVIGHGTLMADFQSWWAKARGQEDPNSLISNVKGLENQIEGDRFWALKGIDLEIKQGEILGIIGKNGAGKSTFLKILSRVTAPTKGCIKVNGRIASLLEVGTGFHRELTGRENVFLNGAILGMSKHEIKDKFDEIIEFSGIEDFVDTPVKRYSSGMYVRLAFAVAAHLEPEILVVDEVLAVGDVEFQKKCLGKMSEVSREGRTILFVSHNLSAVSNLCDSAILLKNGRIKSKGDVPIILDEYMGDAISIQDLTKEEGRQGNGVVQFTSVTVYSNKQTKEMKIKTGDPFYIEVEYEGDTEALGNGRIDVGVDDSFGNRLLWFSTTEHNSVDFKYGNLVFSIDKMALNEGSYYITLFCEVNGDVSDWIKRCFSFSVENIANQNNVAFQAAKPKFLIDYNLE